MSVSKICTLTYLSNADIDHNAHVAYLYNWDIGCFYELDLADVRVARRFLFLVIVVLDNILHLLALLVQHLTNLLLNEGLHASAVRATALHSLFLLSLPTRPTTIPHKLHTLITLFSILLSILSAPLVLVATHREVFCEFSAYLLVLLQEALDQLELFDGLHVLCLGVTFLEQVVVEDDGHVDVGVG